VFSLTKSICQIDQFRREQSALALTRLFRENTKHAEQTQQHAVRADALEKYEIP
jgi:hypothetical protein